jgi:hypothetical protein
MEKRKVFSVTIRMPSKASETRVSSNEKPRDWARE